MTVFYQAAAWVLIACILGMVISGQNKAMATLLSLAVIAGILTLAVQFLNPVFSFLNQLQSVGNMDQELTGILMKITGIALISEISGMVCKDAGNASLGKSLQFFASAVILWLSIPVFQRLLLMVEEILGGI